MDLMEQLDHIFSPRTVAVIGASDSIEKAGFMCVKGLLVAGFKGKIYPVNPELSELSGLKVYPSVGAIPGEVDLAIIAIPAHLTLSAVEECVAKGIAGVIIFTSGFKEVGTEIGLDMQNEIREIASKAGMKVIGPNCLGVVNPYANLNATFDAQFSLAKAGSVAIAGQSGGVCSYLTEAFINGNVGVSKVVSMGNRCNVDFDEIVEYFAGDEKTKVIVLYIEGLERPRKLMSVARQVVKRKPIVAYKVGRTEELNQASLSHTGSLAGKYQFYEAAFRQAGIITVDDMTELVDVAKALAFQPPSSGNRVAVLSGPAGIGIILATKCYELGLRLAELLPSTRKRLRQFISPLTSVDNPVDLGWAFRELHACREIFRAVMEDDNVDMIVAGSVFPNVNMNFNQAIIDISSRYRKPITLACIHTSKTKDVTEIDKLEKNNIPTYPFPERAVTALAGLFKYGRILKAVD